MGQQQLLLLVLGIVIVGLAVVVGIQAFSENQKKANADALVNDAIRIASDAQAWMLKPTAFGGGSNSCASTCDWTNATFPQLGYPVTGTGYSNLNGTFTIDGASSSTDLVIVASSAANGNQVTVTVTGTTPDRIDTQVDTEYVATSG